jgi:hypothetical protein
MSLSNGTTVERLPTDVQDALGRRDIGAVYGSTPVAEPAALAPLEDAALVWESGEEALAADRPRLSKRARVLAPLSVLTAVMGLVLWAETAAWGWSPWYAVPFAAALASTLADAGFALRDLLFGDSPRTSLADRVAARLLKEQVGTVIGLPLAVWLLGGAAFGPFGQLAALLGSASLLFGLSALVGKKRDAEGEDPHRGRRAAAADLLREMGPWVAVVLLEGAWYQWLFKGSSPGLTACLAALAILVKVKPELRTATSGELERQLKEFARNAWREIVYHVPRWLRR